MSLVEFGGEGEDGKSEGLGSEGGLADDAVDVLVVIVVEDVEGLYGVECGLAIEFEFFG